MKKLQITLEEALFNQLDEFSENDNRSKSSTISIALKQYFNAQLMVDSTVQIARSLQKIANQGFVSPEDEIDIKRLNRTLDKLGWLHTSPYATTNFLTKKK